MKIKMGNKRIMDIIVFFIEYLKISVFDRLMFIASPCVADIPCILYLNTPVVKREQVTCTDWRHEFG